MSFLDPRQIRGNDDDVLSAFYTVLFIFYVAMLIFLLIAIIATTSKSHGAAPSTWSEDQLPECCTDDLTRFPNLACAEQNLERARKHREWLETTAQLYPWNWTGEQLCALRQESENSLWVWERLESLHRGALDGGWVSSHTLGCMREYLGPRAYYRGEMPPSVPAWRRFGE